MRISASANACRAVMILIAGNILAAAPALAQNVGVTAAVNPATMGKPPSGSIRQLSIGAQVVHNERINTSASGSLQLVFIDRTTLSIGPNSEVVIDEFVFDPNTNSAKMAITVGKGLLRFVGGQVSHNIGATIKTPVATMGVRGGVALYNVGPNLQTTVVHLVGVSTVTAGGSTQQILRPGYYVEITSMGAAPSVPKPAPAGLIAAYNAQLQSKPGQTGGRRNAAAAQVGSRDVTGSIETTDKDWQLNWDARLAQRTAGQEGGVDQPPQPPPPSVTWIPPGLLVAPGQIGFHLGPPGQDILPPGHGGPSPHGHVHP